MHRRAPERYNKPATWQMYGNHCRGPSECQSCGHTRNARGGESVPAAQGPMLARRRLRQALRRARETAGLTQEHVAGEMEWSLSKVIRIEAGIVGVAANDLKALFRLYNIA